MKDIFLKKKVIRQPGPLKRHYDVVIIGGGSHGLATAYYLAKHHGITDVAILEKSYIGSGAAGRNTTIVRSNYRTPEGAAFYTESVKLYEKLSARARLQPHVLAARPLHAGALRSLAGRPERARRGQQAAWHRQPRDRSRRGEEALSSDLDQRGRDLADPGCALPPARRNHPSRRRGVGLRQAGRPLRHRHPPGRRGDGNRRPRWTLPRCSHHARRCLGRCRAERDRRLVESRSRSSPGSSFRSPPRSSRPS